MITEIGESQSLSPPLFALLTKKNTHAYGVIWHVNRKHQGLSPLHLLSLPLWLPRDRPIRGAESPRLHTPLEDVYRTERGSWFCGREEIGGEPASSPSAPSPPEAKAESISHCQWRWWPPFLFAGLLHFVDDSRCSFCTIAWRLEIFICLIIRAGLQAQCCCDNNILDIHHAKPKLCPVPLTVRVPGRLIVSVAYYPKNLDWANILEDGFSSDIISS